MKLNILLLILFLSNCTVTDILVEEQLGFILNPNNVTPLSGVYKIESINTQELTVRVHGKTSEMDIMYTYPANFGIEFPIHGLYPNHTNFITIKENGIEKQYIINVGSISSLNLSSKYIINMDNFPRDSDFNQDIYFISTAIKSKWLLVGIDRYGDTRYINTKNSDLFNESYKLIGTDTEMLIMNSSGIETLLGESKFNLRGSNKDGHHDMVNKGNNYLYLGFSQWGSEDRLIEVNSSGIIVRDLLFGSLIRDIVTNSGNTAEINDMNKIVFDHDNIFIENGEEKQIDWAHANSLVYDESNDRLYMSWRNQAVVAVDYSEWKLVWWMADDTLDTQHSGVPNVGMNFLDLPSLDAYRVKGVGKTDGPKNQHALILFEDDRLGMFDNQGDEPSNLQGSRYIEYRISGSYGNWSAIQTDEYKDSSLYSQITSDVDITGENHENILIGWGVPGRIREIKKEDQTILFDMQYKSLDGDTFFYRVDKKPFYPRANKKYSVDSNMKNKL